MPEVGASQVAGLDHGLELAGQPPVRQDPFDVRDEVGNESPSLASEYRTQLGFEEVRGYQTGKRVQPSGTSGTATFIEGNGDERGCIA